MCNISVTQIYAVTIAVLLSATHLFNTPVIPHFPLRGNKRIGKVFRQTLSLNRVGARGSALVFFEPVVVSSSTRCKRVLMWVIN